MRRHHRDWSELFVPEIIGPAIVFAMIVMILLARELVIRSHRRLAFLFLVTLHFRCGMMATDRPAWFGLKGRSTMETKDSETQNIAKLAAAGKKAEAQQAAKRERDVKGSHLLDTMVKRAEAKGLKTDDKSDFLQISGPSKSKKIYVAKKGGRADLSGFTLDHAAVRQVTAEAAKKKHLGKVRGHLDFGRDDEEVLDAYERALDIVAQPAEEKAS